MSAKQYSSWRAAQGRPLPAPIDVYRGVRRIAPTMRPPAAEAEDRRADLAARAQAKRELAARLLREAEELEAAAAGQR